MIRIANKEEIIYFNKNVDYIISNNAFEKCYVYLLNDKIIGFIDFSEIYNRIELNYIWINPLFRGNDYSKDLMNYLINYCLSIDCINITLEVAINNDVAKNLYKQFYFEEVALRKNYYNGIDGMLMIRKFDKNE